MSDDLINLIKNNHTAEQQFKFTEIKFELMMQLSIMYQQLNKIRELIGKL